MYKCNYFAIFAETIVSALYRLCRLSGSTVHQGKWYPPGVFRTKGELQLEGYVLVRVGVLVS